MTKRLTKKTMFMLSLVIFGAFGFIQSIINENFSKSKSAFKKEDQSSLPQFVERAHADNPALAGCTGSDGSDGSGDGSNGF